MYSLINFFILLQ